MPQDHEITLLLHRWKAGEESALETLVPPRIATHRAQVFAGERPGQTLQTTDLVNDAYLKIADQTRVEWQNRAHFFAIAAQIMRRLLVDHARKQNRAKRGGGVQYVALSDAAILSP